MLVKLTDRFRNIVSHWRRHHIETPIGVIPVLIISIGVTVALLGFRQLGKLESLELGAYDQAIRSRSNEKIDTRILVVAVTEEDIRQLRQWPLSDATIAKVVANLQKYQPIAIGIDIYRDIPVEPGYQQLVTQFKQNDRLIAICKSNDLNKSGVAPPPTIPKDRLGFSDLPIDPDGVIRRALLFVTPRRGKCQTRFSFSFQLASRYLAAKGIESYKVEPSGDMGFKKVGESKNPIPLAVFKRLDPEAGGYQGTDAAGYQILLNYRSARNVAQEVTLTEVLTDRIRPELVRDRIVLIGVTAASGGDTFYTPFSPAMPQDAKMPGVIVHAQIVSQILSAALDNKRLLWYMPNWGEALWIWGWSIVGGAIAWKLRHPVWLGLSGAAALSLLSGISYGALLSSAWIPIVPAGLALVSTGGSVVVYAAYKMYQQQQEVAQQAQEQQAIIAMLSTMLNAPPRSSSSTTPFSQAGTVSLGEDLTVPVTSSAAETTPPVTPNFFTSRPLLADRYQITKVLAQGGFGQTYLAEDTQRPGNPICVVKQLMPARRDSKFLQVARRLFQTEAKILEVLGQHDQIPQLLAYLEEKEEFYLVEEYIQGLPLTNELPVDKRLSEKFVVNLLTEILEILAFIQQHQVIHRDIKPSNIIRREKDDRLVLIDFGAVKQIQPPSGPETESPTVAIGTRGYAPPEQLAGYPRPASDIYAVGMIGIQALTGIATPHLPRDEETGAVVWRPLANVSDELADILDRMVSYHFSDRYQSATAVLKELNRLDRTMLATRAIENSLTNFSEKEIQISLDSSPTLPDSPQPSSTDFCNTDTQVNNGDTVTQKNREATS